MPLGRQTQAPTTDLENPEFDDERRCGARKSVTSNETIEMVPAAATSPTSSARRRRGRVTRSIDLDGCLARRREPLQNRTDSQRLRAGPDQLLCLRPGRWPEHQARDTALGRRAASRRAAVAAPTARLPVPPHRVHASTSRLLAETLALSCKEKRARGAVCSARPEPRSFIMLETLRVCVTLPRLTSNGQRFTGRRLV